MSKWSSKLGLDLSGVRIALYRSSLIPCPKYWSLHLCVYPNNRTPIELRAFLTAVETQQQRPTVIFLLGMSSLVKTSYSHNVASTAMAMCSSFCPQIPNQFRGRPISSFPSRQPFSVPFKAFTSQANIKGNFVMFPDNFVFFFMLMDWKVCTELLNGFGTWALPSVKC